MTDGRDAARSLLDPDLIGDVVRRLAGTDIDELEVSDGASRLYIRREPGSRTLAAGQSSMHEADTVHRGSPIAAPLTGVFYSRPSPDQSAFASVGSDIEIDDVVGLIETMKLFNEVKADVAGRVIEIVAKDGDLVEAGRPLMFVAQAAEED